MFTQNAADYVVEMALTQDRTITEPGVNDTPKHPAVSPNGTSHLLKLPRELLDNIYEYALTEEGGLVKDSALYKNHMQKFPTRCFWATDDETEKKHHNQLKFVCRQLYAQTKGLGLRYNDLTFRGASTVTGLELLHDFVTYECSKTQLNRIRKIVVTDPLGYGYCRSFSGELSRFSAQLKSFSGQLKHLKSHGLVTYAQTYPRTSISVRLSFFDTSLIWWVMYGSAIQYFVRGTVPEIEPAWLTSFMLPTGFGVFRGFLPLPANVTLLPAEFKEDISGDDFTLFELPREDWIVQCREWYENGF